MHELSAMETNAVSVRAIATIGFIGVGVMGEPICRHLAQKSSKSVNAFDLDTQPLARLAEFGVTAARSIADVAQADVVFVSLPSGEVVNEIARGAGGLLEAARPGQLIVDLSTSSVDTTRELAAAFAERAVTFVDAPVARTRAAAEAGQLSVMVGADAATFARLSPLLATFASDITLCGDVGCGQVMKILNNMVLFQNVVAACEAAVIGQRLGVEPAVLFSTLAKGSADSFGLRNHGMKAVLPQEFPLRSFSVRYAKKDLAYGLLMAAQASVPADTAQRIDALFDAAISQGFGEQYWPVVSRLIGN